MAFTQNDLIQVEAAIITLSTAKRDNNFKFKAMVDIGGRQEAFAVPRLSELIALRDQIKAELAAATNRSKIFRSRFSKGL